MSEPFPIQSKQRKDRPLAALNRAVWESITKNPSSSAAVLTTNGRATQKQFVADIAKVMTCLVNEMCCRSRKIGVATRQGFVLRTWGYVAVKTGLPVWRVKQCANYASKKGWITSVQPRESYTGKDNKEKWRGLASIKRVTESYFKDLALYENYLNAKECAIEWLKAYARKLERPVKYIQTPVTLLARRRKEAAERKAPETNPIPI